jgi:hypothetical protein
LKKVRELTKECVREKLSMKRNQPMERPYDRSMLQIFEKQLESQSSLSGKRQQ